MSAADGERAQLARARELGSWFAAWRVRTGRGTAVRSEPVTCPQCEAVGATADESFLIHHDGDLYPADAAAGPGISR